MKKDIKIIFHIDLNSFFASCAVIKEPYLKDKVFVVGGNAAMRRGVISTASYPARKLGIHSAMNIPDAMRIYP
ncbi:MAG: DNA polymerase IV, partial [Acholeplasma sp.]